MNSTLGVGLNQLMLASEHSKKHSHVYSYFLRIDNGDVAMYSSL